MSKRRLGRGLDALLTSSAIPNPVTRSEHNEVAIDDVVRGRYQPRSDFNEEALMELVASIKAQGLMQPIVVRPRPQGGYELIAGERRWRAAQRAGMTTIPAVIKEATDEQASAMTLVENIQREDLKPLEEATALERLKEEFQLTQQQIADAVGKSRVAVTNLLRLLNLEPRVREMLAMGALEMGHARALLTLDSIEQERTAKLVAKRQLSVRQTEALVRRIQSGTGRSAAPAQKDRDTQRLEHEISEKIGAPVNISHNAKGKGQVVIRYASLDELDGILKHLR